MRRHVVPGAMAGAMALALAVGGARPVAAACEGNVPLTAVVSLARAVVVARVNAVRVDDLGVTIITRATVETVLRGHFGRTIRSSFSPGMLCAGDATSVGQEVVLVAGVPGLVVGSAPMDLYYSIGQPSGISRAAVLRMAARAPDTATLPEGGPDGSLAVPTVVVPVASLLVALAYVRRTRGRRSRRSVNTTRRAARSRPQA